MWEFLKKLRRFDAYSKTLEDVRIQTLGGGTSKLYQFEIAIISYFLYSSLIN